MPAIDIGSLMNRLNRTLIQSSKNGTNSIDEDFTNNTEDQDHGKKLINTIFTLVVIGVILLAFPLFTSLACIVRKCCMNRKGFLVDWSRHCYIWMIITAVLIVLIDIFIRKVPVDILYLFFPSYLLVTIETFHSKEWHFLKFVVYFKDVESYVRTLTTARPQVFLRDDDEFHYGSWDDFSKIQKLPATKKRAVATRLVLKQNIQLDADTVDGVKKQRQQEIEEGFDELNSYDKANVCIGKCCCGVFPGQKITKEIPGFKKFVLVCHRDTKPFWIKKTFFVIMTMLLLGWPYRWFFQGKVKLVKFKLKKKISMFTGVYSMPVTDI